MKTAYRIPDNDCNCVEPGTAPKAAVPINRFKVRSFITYVADGATLEARTPSTLKGIAFDGGTGIKAVAVSTDGGNTWAQAGLGFKRDFWQAEGTKMIKVDGAPIDEADVGKIVDYLEQTYGLLGGEDSTTQAQATRCGTRS